jgi:hypothetical protein
LSARVLGLGQAGRHGDQVEARLNSPKAAGQPCRFAVIGLDHVELVWRIVERRCFPGGDLPVRRGLQTVGSSVSASPISVKHGHAVNILD